MARQQTKRRRKRYQAGSAYAGDVKPAGILGILGSQRTMQIIFVGMALAFIAGGAATIFTTKVFNSSSSDNPSGFVLPPDQQDTPEAEPTVAIRQYSAPPAMTIDVGKKYTATIKTELGDIEVELLPTEAPETVNNFVFLANDGFYNGLVFHFVRQDFEAIAGDPACSDLSDACRGLGGPGYELDEQISGQYEPGTLGMANGSQFFIALTASTEFDAFTPFGKIVSGLDIAERLQPGTKIEAIQIQEA